MLLELENAIEEGDLETSTVDIFSHKLSLEESGFGIGDTKPFEPTPPLDAYIVGEQQPTGGCGRDVTEIATMTLVSSVFANVNCENHSCGVAIDRCMLDCSSDCTTIFTRINHREDFTDGEFQFKMWFSMITNPVFPFDRICALQIIFWDGEGEWGNIGVARCVRTCEDSSCIGWNSGYENYCVATLGFHEGCLHVNEGHFTIFIDNATKLITPYSIVNLGVSCNCFTPAVPCFLEDDLCCGYGDLPEIITSAIPFTYADVSGIIGTYNVTVDDTTVPATCSSYHTHAEITLTIAGP